MSPLGVKLTDNTVFIGLCEDKAARPLVLLQAHMLVYWSQDTRGLGGVASNGPTRNCKIGPEISVVDMEAKSILYTFDVSTKAYSEVQKEYWP